MPDLTGLKAVARLGGFDPVLNAARAAGVALWGPGVGAMVAAAAVRYGNRPAVIDDDGAIDYRRLDRRATSLAAYLRRQAGDGAVAILGRNHRGFILAQLAAERAGVDLVMLSTALAPASLDEVLRREHVTVVVADDDFGPLVTASGRDVTVLSADGRGPDSIWTVSRTLRVCPPSRRRSRVVLLTSGTTGPPKGARRSDRAPRLGDLDLVARIGYHLGDTFYVAPPLFHAWGLSQATSSLATASTLLLRRRFDAAEALELLATNDVDVLAVVPVMLRRMLDVTADADFDTTGITPPRIVATSGNVLPGSLAISWMDTFGDHLYNFYGSTEAAIGTIAGPDELRAAPGTVGRPPAGVTLRILDDDGQPVAQGRPGRVHLESSYQFSGYTDGSGGERAGELLATGDYGYVDADGLLHIDGRVGDMIVTGGENVFPSRVEEVLDRQPEIEQSAVVGIDDDEFGQRVVAFVVVRNGTAVDVEALRAVAATELESFMVPREVVVVDELPMTATGKVIRRALTVR